MYKNLYRYRSIEKILSTEDLKETDNKSEEIGYDELRKNQIYLSPLESLNDPMEGYKNIFWKGDKIIWENFVKHYTMCLSHSLMEMLIKGPQYKLETEKIPVFNSHKQYKDDIVNNILMTTSKSKEVAGYIESFSKATRKIRKNELRAYLESLTPYIIDIILEELFREGMVSKRPESAENKKILIDQKKLESLLVREETEEPEKINLLILEKKNELKIITLINANINQIPAIEIYYDFPEKYLKAIETITYPNSTIACFSETSSNPSMWSHYSGNHSGVCLQFRIEDNFLPVMKITGYGGSVGNAKYSSSKSHLLIHQVKYDEDYPEIDFFRTMGRLNMGTLYGSWLTDENGNRSSTFSDIDNDEENWRKNYWNNHPNILTRKLPEWNYEREYRAISTSQLFHVDQISKNTFYEFDSLGGIIFGMNTKTEHKIKIINIIKKKCKEQNRDYFPFYQSFYDREKKNIGKIKLEKISKM